MLNTLNLQFIAELNVTLGKLVVDNMPAQKNVWWWHNLN
jgi:hypothetical protein